MIKVDFKLNKKLEILVDEKYFNSNVQDVTEEYIAISIPTNSGEYLPLSSGSIIDVIYYEEENIYKFSSTIIGRKFENIPILLLAKPEEIKKIQRRKYVRVPLIKTAKYINLKNEPKVNLSTIDSSKYLKAVIIDLSGGGMRVKVSEEIKNNDFLLVALTVNEEEVLIVGQTKRIMKDNDGRFISGLSFEFLDKATQEQLIRYIFQLMRNQMKKI
ncbi:flagellar brake protein [Clostridium estertheticum]|uniref:flagellar brake protein n=1 Tax=Clostridium estertheticum TaxID=238834 RepID=UPI001C7DAA37|nr:flagellar brake domain-containing protein [Clostridium estertheticum]MBX4265201.1 flagellar brake domain-containing protein [Clostridium estertheticum]WLC90431.1 flagellar brake domain-containing protein [Clostridium estertheticum]